MQRDRQYTSNLAGALGSIAIHPVHLEVVTGQLDRWRHAGTFFGPPGFLPRDLHRPQDGPGFSTEALKSRGKPLKTKIQNVLGRGFRVMGYGRTHLENMAFLFCFGFEAKNIKPHHCLLNPEPFVGAE